MAKKKHTNGKSRFSVVPVAMLVKDICSNCGKDHNLETLKTLKLGNTNQEDKDEK